MGNMKKALWIAGTGEIVGMITDLKEIVEYCAFRTCMIVISNSICTPPKA